MNDQDTVRLLRECDIAQDVFFAFCQAAEVSFCAGDFRFDCIVISAFDRLFITERELDEILVDGTGCFSVFTAEVALDFFGDVLISLAQENVLDCLVTNHL